MMEKVLSLPTKPNSPCSCQRQKGTKRLLSVSFPKDETNLAQVVAEIEPCMNYSDEDRKNLWYARSDYHFSRSTARVIAKESERYGHSKHLDGVYISAFQQQAQDALNLWVLHGHSRRGLERWANSHHGRLRKDDQHMYQQGLLRAQQEMKLKDTCGGDRQAQAERLREVGFVLSRKSRLFAQMMGESDAQAAKWECGMVDSNLPSVPPIDLVLGMGKAAMAEGNTGYPPRCASLMMLPPRRNLGLGGPSQPKVNRVADLPSRAIPQQQRRGGATAAPLSETGFGAATAPKITIKPRAAGRVPRMA